MNKIFTQIDKDSLLGEVKRLEQFMLTSKDNSKILNTYFPYTIDELNNLLSMLVGKEIKNNNFNS